MPSDMCASWPGREFNDGNGRTARLLMNLILIRAGYPPVAVRPEDRLDYVRSLQQEAH